MNVRSLSRLVAFIVAMMACLVSAYVPAQAFHRGTIISTSVVPVGCAQYAIVNGCDVALAGAQFQDTSFATNSAQSGQSLTGRTVLLHTGGYNVPGWDYADGPTAFSGMAAASSLPTGATSAAHPCVYNSAGSAGGGGGNHTGPIVFCQPGTSNANLDITGIDFTNNGSGHGTSCVQLQIGQNQTGITNTTATVHNNWMGAFGGPTNSCSLAWGLVYLTQNGQAPITVTFQNNEGDGQYPNAADSQTGFLWINQSSTLGVQHLVFEQNDLRNFAGRPIGETNVFSGISLDFGQNSVFNPCAAGNVGGGPHCEVVEWINSNQSIGLQTFKGNLWVEAGSIQAVDTTAVMFVSTGRPSNTPWTGGVVYDNNLVVINYTFCTNAGPWNSANPCTPGTSGPVSGGRSGNGFIDISGTSVLAAIEMSGNVCDCTGTFNHVILNGGSLMPTPSILTADTTSTAGQFNITAQVANNCPLVAYCGTAGQEAGVVQPGQTVTNTNAAFGQAILGAYAGGTLGQNSASGLGTIPISGEATDLSTNANWRFWTTVQSCNYGSNNYAVESGSAVPLSFPACSVLAWTL